MLRNTDSIWYWYMHSEEMRDTAHGLWTSAVFRVCVVSPNQYSTGSYTGFYPQSNYRNLWIHHHLSHHSSQLLSFPLYCPALLAQELFVHLEQWGSGAGDWTFCSWARRNHVNLKPWKKESSYRHKSIFQSVANYHLVGSFSPTNVKKPGLKTIKQ